MAQQGRLTEWNDDRGYGFITPLGGGPKLFVHVSEFPRDLRRPMLTDLVTYDSGTGRDGRPCAVGVLYLAPAHARHEEDSHPLSAFELGLPGAFALVLIGIVASGAISPLVLVYYFVLSVVAFFAYWQDKRAATSGEWRTPESTLLGVALIGGWPGAFLARHVFRHKTRKQPFRTKFWIAVITNCAVLTLLGMASVMAPG